MPVKHTDTNIEIQLSLEPNRTMQLEDEKKDKDPLESAESQRSSSNSNEAFTKSTSPSASSTEDDVQSLNSDKKSTNNKPTSSSNNQDTENNNKKRFTYKQFYTKTITPSHNLIDQAFYIQQQVHYATPYSQLSFPRRFKQNPQEFYNVILIRF